MQGIQVEFYTWHAVIGDRQAISVYPCRRLAATRCFVTLVVSFIRFGHFQKLGSIFRTTFSAYICSLSGCRLSTVFICRCSWGTANKIRGELNDRHHNEACSGIMITAMAAHGGFNGLLGYFNGSTVFAGENG